jgi:hypothetical protein
MNLKSTMAQRVNSALCASALLLGLSAPAAAVTLETGFGGTAGYGDLAMLPNDDQSSNLLNLPFNINFFGQTYSNFYVNNNGNVTFGGPVGDFTPISFPFNRPIGGVGGGGGEGGPVLAAAAAVSNIAMIAPYWGDVDTRCAGCGAVYVASPNASTVVVTWNDVGYYPSNNSLTNNFQLVLKDKSVAGNTATTGDFDITFRYDRLQWTTGDASGGAGGTGGTPAQAGFDAGNGVNFFTVPGSQTAAVLNLANTTNVAGGPDGLWTFAIRAGAVPGTTADNPLLPVTTEAGWNFNFNVILQNQRIFIDPAIAVGYDYKVVSGPNFRSVLLPTGIGDNLYALWLWNGTDWYDALTQITGGIEYFFGGNGVDRFRILGIETDAGLDPTNTLAFTTGLTFEGTGAINVTQTAISTNVDINAVPEPSALLIMLTGLAGVMGLRSRRRKTVATVA